MKAITEIWFCTATIFDLYFWKSLANNLHALVSLNTNCCLVNWCCLRLWRTGTIASLCERLKTRELWGESISGQGDSCWVTEMTRAGPVSVAGQRQGNRPVPLKSPPPASPELRRPNDRDRRHLNTIVVFVGLIHPFLEQQRVTVGQVNCASCQTLISHMLQRKWFSWPLSSLARCFSVHELTGKTNNIMNAETVVGSGSALLLGIGGLESGLKVAENCSEI